MNAMITIAVAAAVVLAACSDNSSAPQEKTPPKPAATAPQQADPCEMQGMDMSKMSAEEHQKMMDDCEKAKRAKGSGQ